MLSHWKSNKIKTPQKKKARQAVVYIVCYDNLLWYTKGFYQVQHWCNTYNSSLISVFADPLRKEKRPVCYDIIKKYKFPGYLQELYCHAVRLYTNDALFQEIMYRKV